MHLYLHSSKTALFYGHLSLNTKEAKGEEEDEIFKSDWSQRGLKALGNNQTTKHTSVQDCLHKTYTHVNCVLFLRKLTNIIHCFC